MSDVPKIHESFFTSMNLETGEVSCDSSSCWCREVRAPLASQMSRLTLEREHGELKAEAARLEALLARSEEDKRTLVGGAIDEVRRYRDEHAAEVAALKDVLRKTLLFYADDDEHGDVYDLAKAALLARPK